MERDLKADLELCEKATSGAWESSPAGNWYGAEVNYWQVLSDYETVADLINNKYDAEFIAEAREAMPYWLGRVVELEATVLHMQTVIKGVLAIVNQSEGVAGWHLNGEIAKWEEFGYPKELEQALSSEAGKEMLGRVKRLETVVEEVRKLIIREKCEAIPCPNTIKAYRKVLKILESSNPPTYKEPLERVQKLEAVAEALREYYANCTDYGECETLNDKVNCFVNCPKDKIKQALAALDGDK
ncbi:MAG: hypothetical protein ACOY9Y_10805 [Bacillota bacterium]